MFTVLPAHSRGRRKFSENPLEVGVLQTKSACIFGCPVHTVLWKKDVTAVSGHVGLSSEPAGWSRTGLFNKYDSYASKNASRWKTSWYESPQKFMRSNQVSQVNFLRPHSFERNS